MLLTFVQHFVRPLVCLDKKELSFRRVTAVYTRGLVYHDSGSQNVRILKHGKHYEITIQATLALASPANRGVFNTA